MKSNFRIEKVDKKKYSDEDWKRFFDFLSTCFGLKNEPMPYDSWLALKDQIIKADKEADEHMYMVWENEEVNRTFIFSIKYKDDLNKRFTYLQNWRGNEKLDPRLLEKIFIEFIGFDEKSTALALRSDDGANDYVESRYGAKVGSNSETFELHIKEAKKKLIDEWLEQAPSKHPNLRIAFYDEIPDDLLEEFAALFSQLMADMPENSIVEDTKVTAATIKARQEAFKVKDYCIYNFLIFNEADELIAKTHVSLKRKRPKVMYQHMTGVMENYRGRGLSKWLKAAMFKKLNADFPELEVITTQTHPENHASKGLSKQMGYKKTGTAKEFIIDRSNIISFLKTKD